MKEAADKLLNTKQIQKNLNIGKDRVYRMLNDGTLPSTKIGCRYYVSRKNLNNWIAKSAGKRYY